MFPSHGEPEHGYGSESENLTTLTERFIRVLDGSLDDSGELDTLWARCADPFKAGRLMDAVAFWRNTLLPEVDVSDTLKTRVLSWIEHGVHVPEFCRMFRDEFDGINYEAVYPPAYMADNHSVTPEMAAYIESEIQSLVLDGSIEQVDVQPRVVMPLFAVQQGDKRRMIYDARYLNCFTPSEPVRYDSLRDFQRGLALNDKLVAMDHKQGYHQMRVTSQSRTLLGLRWKGKFYVWRVLPFGWAPACFVYHTTSTVAMAFLRKRGFHMLVYLDDIAARAASAAESSQRARWRTWCITALMYLCGYVLSIPKCKLDPQSRMEVLGFGLDTESQQYYVPRKKLEAITAELREIRSTATVRLTRLQRIVGKVQSLSLAVPCVSVHLSAAYGLIASASKYHCDTVVVTRELSSDFESLLELEKWTTFSKWLSELHTQLRMETDAAGGEEGGWGACIWLPSGGVRHAHGAFVGSLAHTHINERETLAVVNAVELLCVDVRDCIIVLFVDNETVRHCILRGNSKLRYIRDAARQLLRFQITNNVCFRIHRVSTHDNVVADALSRTGLCAPVDYSEYHLADELFRRVQAEHGVFTIDTCAAWDNKQLPKYICGPAYPDSGAVAQNVFLCTFTKEEFLYCYPPFRLVSPVWRHFKLCGARGVMIVPNDGTAAWFGLVNSEALSTTKIASRGDTAAVARRKRDRSGWMLWTLTSDLLAVRFDFSLEHK